MKYKYICISSLAATIVPSTVSLVSCSQNLGSEDQFINTISNDILKNSSPINCINYEYIDNTTNKLSSLFPKYNFKNCSVQLVNENNKCKLVINTNNQEIKVPLPYNLKTFLCHHI